MPYDIEFRKELPKTLVGKVAYRVLEEEEEEKRKAEQEAEKAAENK
jgi:long-chain acyl-CoA synthetase